VMLLIDGIGWRGAIFPDVIISRRMRASCR